MAWDFPTQENLPFFFGHNLLIFVFAQLNQHAYIFLELITGKPILCKAKEKQEPFS